MVVLEKQYWFIFFLLLFLVFTACTEGFVEEVNENVIGGEEISYEFSEPNILFILMDDIGKEWFSFYGGSGIELPNLEKFAENSIIYDNFYSMGLCAPSRAALLTGEYPYESGFTGNFGTYGQSTWHLDFNYYNNFVKEVKSAGYYTSTVGKWTSNNLKKAPDILKDIGFDEYLVYPGVDPDEPLTENYHRYHDPILYSSENDWQFYEDAFSEKIFLDSIKQFYTDHKDQKTFMMYNMILPHTPLTYTPLEPTVTGREGKFKGFLNYIDFIIDDLTSHLDELGILDNTCIILTSDNGTSQPLETTYLGESVVSTSKGRLDELSLNIPFMIHWLDANTYGQRRTDVADLIDIYPTMLELAGNQGSNELSGKSLVPSIYGQEHEKEFACSMGITGMRVNDQGRLVPLNEFNARVIRKGDYRVRVNKARTITGLYNVSLDPFENSNLIDDSDFEHIKVEFQEILQGMPAIDPSPKYDPI